MRQKILPENYPNIANSLNNKGISYGNIGNHQKEFQYYMKSLEIRQKYTLKIIRIVLLD